MNIFTQQALEEAYNQSIQKYYKVVLDDATDLDDLGFNPMKDFKSECKAQKIECQYYKGIPIIWGSFYGFDYCRLYQIEGEVIGTKKEDHQLSDTPSDKKLVELFGLQHFEDPDEDIKSWKMFHNALSDELGQDSDPHSEPHKSFLYVKFDAPIVKPTKCTLLGKLALPDRSFTPADNNGEGFIFDPNVVKNVIDRLVNIGQRL